MKYTRLIQIARALKDKTLTGRTWHVSFILNKSKILCIGVNNHTKTHPQNKRFGYKPHQKLHAEMVACLKLGMIDCAGLTIVNIRIDRNDKIVNSCYCAGCQNLIKNLNFKRAYHSDDAGNLLEFNLTS